MKDAAEIRAALDTAGIRDYKIEDQGRTILVRRRDADEARLAMALEGLPQIDKLRKMYYSTWLNSLTEAQKVFLSEDELRLSLDDYINQKQLQNGENQSI